MFDRILLWSHLVLGFFFFGRFLITASIPVGSIPGLGRSTRVRHGNPLQYSCLENAMDRGAWWATVHGIAKLDMTEWLTHIAVLYVISIWWVHAQSLCHGLWLFETMDCSPPGSYVHWIIPARILECVATSFSRRT